MSALVLDDAKTHLNIAAATYDVELQAFIDAAEAAISRWVGPLATTTVTDTVIPSGGNLLLSTLPVISVTSVTPYAGAAVDTSLLTVNASAGIVRYANAAGSRYGSGTPFYATTYTVVYQAGRASVPADLLLAVKELVRHLWTSQRGSGVTRPGAGTMPDNPAGTSYSMPNRVAELLAPHTPLGMG